MGDHSARIIKDDHKFDIDTYDNTDDAPWARDRRLRKLAHSTRDDYCQRFIPHNSNCLSWDDLLEGESSGKYEGSASIEDFEIGGPIGGGISGITYLARVGRIYVALKIIHKQNKSVNFLKEIVREIKILHQLDHPNIIQIYDFFHDEDRIYIVNEYCDGGDLINYVNTHPIISDEKILSIATQIIMGINELHKKHIVHRDIKMENIVMCRGDVVKIIDFGCAVYCYPDQYVDYPPCGTISYSSPETLIRGGKIDQSVDVWSLGIVIYLLITKKFPFTGSTNKQLSNNIFSLNYKRIVDHHSPFNPVIRKIFTYRDDRPKIADLLKLHPFSDHLVLLMSNYEAISKLLS